MNKASEYTVSMTCTLLLMNLHNARCRKIISRVDAQSLFVVPRTAQPKTAIMCRQCTTIDPGSEESCSITFRVRIREILDRIDHLLRSSNNLEDRYREAGIVFHKTERACRLACERNTEWAILYANLEKLFLLTATKISLFLSRTW